jgi:hypothetical protein
MARGTGKSGVEIAQEHVDALIEYLEQHKNEPLPRYGVDLNKPKNAASTVRSSGQIHAAPKS